MMQPAGRAEADVPADQVDALHAPPGVQPSLSVNWLRAGSLVEPPLDMFAGCCEQRLSMAKLMSSLVANASPRWWPTNVLAGHASLWVVRWVSR
jgi:hypothetical protein